MAAAFLLVVPKLLFKAAAEEKRRVRAARNFMVIQVNTLLEEVLMIMRDDDWIFGGWNGKIVFSKTTTVRTTNYVRNQ